jgi:hypothetical protein
MSSFAIRSSRHDDFIAEIAAALGERDWESETYGQEAFQSGLRRILKDQPALDRWRPDLVASREGRVRLIDGKTCTERNRTSANYAIEKASISALATHERMTGWPVLIVFYDWRVAPAKFIWEMVEQDRLQPIPFVGYGSGTPGWLLPKGTTCLLDFDAVFGSAR